MATQINVNFTALSADLLENMESQNRVFPKIEGPPTFHQIRSMQKKTIANAGACDCNIAGTGDFGYLFLAYSDAEWHDLTDLHPVIPPTEPDLQVAEAKRGPLIGET